MSARYYINCPLQPGPVLIDGPEARHLAAVCRVRPGDQVILFNGDGHEYPARVEEVARKDVGLTVLDRLSPQRELGFALELAAPLPKGDRGRFLIEKLTELGVTTFVPLTCQHSVIDPREGRLDKLRRYVVEASKQCGRNVLMRIEDPAEWSSYCLGREGTLSVLAHPAEEGEKGRKGEGETAISSPFLPFSPSPLLPHRLAVGPEAGFTAAEVEQARAAGWRTIDLGPRILRIETAALVLATWSVATDLPAGLLTQMEHRYDDR